MYCYVFPRHTRHILWKIHFSVESNKWNLIFINNINRSSIIIIYSFVYSCEKHFSCISHEIVIIILPYRLKFRVSQLTVPLTDLLHLVLEAHMTLSDYDSILSNFDEYRPINYERLLSSRRINSSCCTIFHLSSS